MTMAKRRWLYHRSSLRDAGDRHDERWHRDPACRSRPAAQGAGVEAILANAPHRRIRAA